MSKKSTKQSRRTLERKTRQRMAAVSMPRINGHSIVNGRKVLSLLQRQKVARLKLQLSVLWAKELSVQVQSVNARYDEVKLCA